jgi:hypothetical protein
MYGNNYFIPVRECPSIKKRFIKKYMEALVQGLSPQEMVLLPPPVISRINPTAIGDRDAAINPARDCSAIVPSRLTICQIPEINEMGK